MILISKLKSIAQAEAINELCVDPKELELNEDEVEKPVKLTRHTLKTNELGEAAMYQNIKTLTKDKFSGLDARDKNWKVNIDRVMELSLGIQKELEELKEDTDFMDDTYYNIWNRLSRRPKV